MISFLRKIRKKALDDGNIKKVAMYAIGELFLIVVGILIAVNINNWNKDRSDRQALLVSLNGLINDMHHDIDRFSFLSGQFDESLINCDSIIFYLNLPDSDPDKTRIFKFDFIRLFVLNPHTAAYEEMKNSGKLYSIRDTGLSADIIKYYTSLSRNELYIENSNDGLRIQMDQPRLNDFWLASRKDNSNGHLNWLQDKNSDTHRALEFLTHKAKGRYKSNKRKVVQLKLQAENLLSRIQDEIDVTN